MQTLNYLPPILQEIKEFKIITTCNDSENTELNICIDNLYKDQFIITTETAIKRYESMLGIIPKGTDTLEDRRFRVLAIYNKQLPYTKTVLEQNLTTFCGEDGYKLIMDYANNVLTVKIALTAKSMFDTVKNYLEGVIPMNLTIDLSLLYNQWMMFEQYTWEHLEQYTWEQLREEVIS
ncbi:YmfQ family protein [Anaerocolumna aminovalerica]|uniref:putative phage tail protein n=1 Tax=Anaerocolumna aminovalerica TaxID=1527 RepID=UPI001C0E8F99|nr:putative phage tail protein [Anaerocolumna aminovalerica]MBU5331406.1 YmfQ family protein [Anaerocolumna aminovalerica]